MKKIRAKPQTQMKMNANKKVMSSGHNGQKGMDK